MLTASVVGHVTGARYDTFLTLYPAPCYEVLHGITRPEGSSLNGHLMRVLEFHMAYPGGRPAGWRNKTYQGRTQK